MFNNFRADDTLIFDEQTDELIADDDNDSDSFLEDSNPYTPRGTNDYNLLLNKPEINGVQLIGNKLIADLFPNGLIIDGGEGV